MAEEMGDLPEACIKICNTGKILIWNMIDDIKFSIFSYEFIFPLVIKVT